VNVRRQNELKVQVGKVYDNLGTFTVYDMSMIAAVVIVSAAEEQSGVIIKLKVTTVGEFTDVGSLGLVTLTCSNFVPSSLLSVD
jgi:hypothetical protein